MALTSSDPSAAELSDPGALGDADVLGAQLIRLLRAVGRARHRVIKHGPEGLEQLAYAMLFTLVHDGPQRTGKLAEQLHAEISTVSRQTRNLVSHGLIERRADPIDGRACVLEATAEGRRVFAENRRLRNRWIAELVADWSAADRAALTGLLARLVDGIENSTATLDSE
ncbi:MarR family transcriptional regulator [Nocardia yunnanensis]|uniref:MarR family transcriptional regulator n=1 Tax=Nocardia yunnanensis TaxID=2382165 RepID=A0A386ZF98_9NOCA|nr:MarR family transcriptional regulator [Nocardia yunnanensis]AYF76291.1 MarR family transcriptional regulator [Nocardia yunnanensis]